MKNLIDNLDLSKKRTFNEYLDLSREARELMPDWFRPMLDDTARNTFYQRMIAGQVNDKVVVDLGSGTGMWTIEALSQGAKFVYMIERNPILIKYLQVAFKDSPVKIISKPIEELKSSDFDAGKPEVIIHELFGTAGLSEDVIGAFQKMWKVLPADSVELIPRHIWLEGRVFHTPPLAISAQEKAHLKDNDDLLYELLYPFILKNKVNEGHQLGMSTPHEMFYIDLKDVVDEHYYELKSIPIEFRPGFVHTVHVSFKFSADKLGPTFDTYLENRHHWGDAEVEFYVSKSHKPSTRKFNLKLQENMDINYPSFED